MRSVLVLTADEKRRYRLTTEEFAARRRIKAASVRRRYCVTGSYFGVKPLTGENGRHLWPDDLYENRARPATRG
jgi:hypothetical protein